jgi:membrane-associated phospholipid phosphatase
MRTTKLVCFLLFFTAAPSLFAEGHYNLSRYTHETGQFFTQPVRWHGKDWLTLGVMAAGTVLIMQVDEPIRNDLNRGGRPHFRSFPIEAGRIWGEGFTPPIIAAGFGIHGWLAHKQSSSKIGFEIIQAVTYAEAITQITKIVVGRARPYLNEGSQSYHPFNFKGISFQSLPGGHSTEGWAVSTVLSRNVHSPVLKILVFAPAVLTVVSRIYQDRHWTSDCVLGAAIGFTVGNWVVSHHSDDKRAASALSIAPMSIVFHF